MTEKLFFIGGPLAGKPVPDDRIDWPELLFPLNNESGKGLQRDESGNTILARYIRIGGQFKYAEDSANLP